MIADVQQSLGSKEVRHISQGEMINRHTLAKSIVASRRVEKGSIISRSDCVFKSPGQGLQPIYLEKLIGTKAKRDFDEGDFFYESDLKPETLGSRKYKFSRPVGVPCRYHDIDKMTRPNLTLLSFILAIQISKLSHQMCSKNASISATQCIVLNYSKMTIF